MFMGEEEEEEDDDDDNDDEDDDNDEANDATNDDTANQDDNEEAGAGEDEDIVVDPRGRSPTPKPINSMDGTQERPSGLKRNRSFANINGEPTGMRRTESGMFMPYEEDEPAAAGNGGIVGRVIDTVNTARDIAHVIWNVGWRK